MLQYPDMANKELILGSASERRRKILRGLGVPFDVAVPDVAEVLEGAPPEELVRVNARLKNDWCRERFPGRAVLTADTVVALGSRVFGKPASRDEAREFLRALSGREHAVLTGVAFSVDGGAPRVDVAVSRVRFQELDDARIGEYFRHVDPLDKAGAYDIDQRGDLIIAALEGSHSNVMGLPEEIVAAWLSRFRR